MKRYIVIIPARGGSKRFPGKNIFPFLGLPLIAHSIKYAQKNGRVLDVYVSTDSLDIKQVALQYGAKVLDRPSSLGGDFITSAEVLQNAVETLVRSGVDFDAVVLLQPTNPLRPLELLSEAITIMDKGENDSLFSVSKCDLKLGRINNNQFIPWNYQFGQRSQDLEPLYYENGLMYITEKDTLMQGKIFGDSMYSLPVNHIFGKVDVDTREDMDYAEYIGIKYREDIKWID